MEAEQKPIVPSPADAPTAAPRAQREASGADLFWAQFDNIEQTPIREVFPSRPAMRGGISYFVSERLSPLPNPRWRTLRAWRARTRLWWRRHWWPARIRDLEAALEMYREWE